MMTTRYTFEEIVLKHIERFTCRSCGKPRRRTISYSQTVNPFNKNPDGSVKTRAEVRAAVSTGLAESIEQFRANPYCASCE